MKRIVTSLVLILSFCLTGYAQLQPLNGACEQNPCQAKAICGPLETNTYSYQGNVTPGGLTSCANSLGGTINYTTQGWMYYKFTCYTSGTFNFSLVANDPASDLDWAMWNITSSGCGNLSAINIVYCNSYTAAAPTGIQAVAALGFEPTLNLTAGQTYILGVSRRSGGTVTTGFNITFSGTAVIVNPTPPALASLVPFNACGNVDTVKIKMSAPVRCNQIQNTDFSVPGAPSFTAYGSGCPGCTGATGTNYSNVSDTIILAFSTPLSPGSYTISLNGAAPFFSICGNLPNTAPTLNFSVSAGLKDSVRTGFNCTTSTYIDTVYGKNGVPNYQFKGAGGSLSNTYGAAVPSYQIFTGLTGGVTYTFTVKDAGGCTADSIVFHPAYLPINLITFKKNPPCNNQFMLDTFKVVSISGGKAPYTYSISSTPAAAAASAIQYAPGSWNNLPQANYVITATDAYGCTATATANIANPAILTYTSLPTSTNPQCFGDSTGTITVNTSGGTYPITYSISPNPATAVIPPSGTNPATITGLAGLPSPGLTYTITATDANGCTVTTTRSLTTPNVITLVSTPAVITNPTCLNPCGGAITAQAIGGTGSKKFYKLPLITPPNTYSDSVLFNNGQFINLCAGTYTVLAVDVVGCTKTATYNLVMPPIPTIAVNTVTNVLCNGGCSGQILTTTTGGTTPYSYSITPANNPPCGNATLFGTGDYQNLPVGNYKIVVMSPNNCKDSAINISITEPTAQSWDLPINQANLLCFGNNNGTISATTSGGSGTKTYTISPLGPQSNTTGNFTGLTAQCYTITSTDANLCSITTQVCLTQPTAVAFTSASFVQPLCNGGNTGTIASAASGGTGTITYTISPLGPQLNTTGNFTGLTAQSYTITGTDVNLCSSTTVVVITQPAAVAFTSATFVQPLCFGNNNGTIASAATGGTGTITYTISPLGPQSNTTGNFTGLTAQSYTITGTDVNLCSSTTVVVITQPAAVAFTSATFVQPLCFGNSNGTIASTATGGTGTITYTISPLGPQSNTTGNFTGLTAQSYTITGTDVNSCSSTTVVNVTQPTAVAFTSATFVSPLCFGNSNGTIASAASGGTGTITYTISPLGPQSNTTGNFTGLTAQSYTITGTDVNSCSSTTVVNVTQPTAVAFTSASFVQPLCNGGNTGTIASAASGGTGTITYTISPLGPQLNTTGNFTGLTAQSYTITGTDVNLCSSTTVVVITQPAAVAFTSATFVQPLCFGNNNGTIASAATGGTGTITYTISPLGPQSNTTGNFTGLTAQSYTITGTDVNLCSSTTVVVITQPAAVAFTSATFVQPLCFGNSNGTIASTATGGTGTITYTISPLGPQSNTTGNFTGLTAQSYTITGTDVNSCSSTTVVNVTQPTAVAFTSATFVSPLCFGNSNGTIASAASGGTGTITYTISPLGPQSNTTGNFTGLTAQSYTITGTDVNSCSSTTVVNVTQPTAVAFTSASFVQPLCNGGNTGTIASAASGGTGTITYTISPLGPQLNTTGNFTGLTAQSYTITGTDVNLCSSTTVVVITQPAAVAFTSATFVQPLCFGNNNGTIASAATGGTGTITYTISPLGPQSNTTGNFTGLTAQFYTITGTDVNLCSSTTVVVITQPAAVAFTSATFVQPLCFGNSNGTIASTATGGTGTITYTISPLGPQSNTTGNFTGLTAQSYTITGTDVNSCSSTTVVNVTQPTAVAFTSATFVSPLCFGNSNGTIASAASGGTGTITYTISPLGPQSNTTGNFTGLTAQSYTITGTDVNSCSSTTVVNVTQPTAVAFTSASFVQPLCNGGNTGTIASAASGGTGTITYTISPLGPQSNTTGNFNGLTAQCYTITATDVNACTSTTSLCITQPSAVVVSVTSSTQPSCTPGCDGTITMTGSGGTGPITYSILPIGPTQPTTGNFSGLCAGTTYTITGTDGNLCTGTTTISLSSPGAPVLAVTGQTPVSCFGVCDGTADVTVIANVNYTINNGGTIDPITGAASNLCAGTYVITGTDASSCVGTVSVTIVGPAQLTLAVNTTTNPSCNPGCDGTATFTSGGGNGTNVYSIAPSGTINPSTGASSVLCAGITYTVTVTDANNCSATATVLLTTPASPVITITASTNPSCNPGCDGTATVTAIAGGAYTISPSGTINGATGAASGLCDGIMYTIQVTDANGCTGQTTILLNAPSAPVINITGSVDPSCNPGCDGTATVTPIAGGVYTISPSGTINGATGAASALCAGVTYTIQVTDANGCTATTSIQLFAPTAPVLTIQSQVDVTCFGQCDGQAQATTIAGVTYTIVGPGTPIVSATGLATNLCVGTYTITGTSAGNCTGTTTVTIIEPSAVVVSVTSSTQPSCTPGCDGTITMTGSGGTGPITYSILPIGPTQPTTGNFSGLCAGTTYTITGTDGNLCTGTTTISLSSPGAPVLAVTGQTPVSCFGVCDGTADVTVIANVNYTINNGGTIDPITGAASNLCAGTYVITGTDASSCVGTVSVTIVGPAQLTLAVNTTTNPSCNPGCDGTATFTSGGGNGTNVYSIAPSGTINPSTGASSVLCAGITYTVTVTDANNCSATATVLLTTPASPVITITASTNPSCNPGCDGTATVTAIAGGAYTISPSGTINGATGAASGLCDGIMYTIQVTDANGCTGQTTILLNAPSAPVINITGSVDPSCNPGCDGTATVTPIAGGVYTISPSGTINGATGAASALCAGVTYTIQVTDANGCTATTSIQLFAPTAPVLTIQSQVDVTCFGQCDGQAQATTIAGVTYTIVGPGTPIVSATGLATNLCVGTYTITGTSAGNCTGTTTVTIIEPSAVVVSVTSSTQPSCTPGCDGTITMTGSGGTGPITYSILPIGPTQPTTGNFSGLCAGTTYTITGTDGNLCTGTTVITLSNPGAPVITVTGQTPVSCFGICDGTASVTVLANVTYIINGIGTPVINPTTGASSNLCGGTYVISATDASSCVGTVSVTIVEPAQLTLTVNTTTNPSCNPGCDGTATFTSGGGNGTNVYSITPSGTINPSTGASSVLCAGITYTVTVTDANNCSATATVLLTTPASPVITITASTNPSCNPGCDGTATVTAIAGGAYTISPSGTINGATGAASGLCDGIMYTIQVTDANGCTGQTTILLNAPSAPVINITGSVDPSCNPGCDGTATVTPIAGGVYTISPSGTINGATGAASALCAGVTYTIQVTDANGCTATTSVTLTAPTPPTITIATSINPSAPLVCDGSGTVATINGTPTYSYSISAGGTIDPLTGAFSALCDGCYTITVTDANMCTGTTSVCVFAVIPTAPTVTAVSVDETCYGACDGTAQATGAGGVPGPGYIYSIAGGSALINPATGAATGLCVGTIYTITVTDANSLTGTTTVTIGGPAQIIISIVTSTNPTCIPGCDGTATVTQIVGGNYTISPSGTIDPATGAASALCSGTIYTITVTNANNCTATTTITPLAPNSPVINILTSTNPTCNPGCDGTATVTQIVGGTYTIAGGGSINSATGAASGLCDGVLYTIQVTDANGCTAQTTIQLTAPTALPISILTSTNPTCNPGCDGIATVTQIVGGTYTIAGGGSINSATGAASGLCDGVLYTIQVTDANGCTAQTTIQLTAPTALPISILTSTNPTCNPGCDGTATVTQIVGGTYTISGGGSINSATGAASALCDGITYTIQVTDANGCTAQTTIQLTAPTALPISILTSTNPTCNPGCDGTATVTQIVGGTYTISGGGSINSATGAASALCDGITYTIQVTDANGCTAQTTIQLTAPTALPISILTSTNPTCNPGCDGTATVTQIVGGTYTISGGGSINSATGAASALCDGITYTIQVTDANGCTAQTTIQLTAPTALPVSILTSTNPTCNPGCDGTATVTQIVGGTYTIAGGGSINSATGAASGLCDGVLYTIQVTDANGCTAQTTIQLTAPTALPISILTSTNPTCNPGCDGTATVTQIVGGTYTIAGGGSINSATGAASGLCDGVLYTIQVTDANGCTAQTTIQLTTPTAPTITIASSTNPTAPAICDGTATVNTVGGTPVYSYAISVGGTIDPITGAMSNLCGQCYTVTVTDANGCTNTTSFCLSNPLSVTAVGNNVSCFGTCDGTGQATGNAGTAPYTYAITGAAVIDLNTGAITGLCAGTVYTITATDFNLATATTTLTISGPTQLTLNAPVVVSPSCNPGCDGTISITAQGGTPGYTYSIASPIGSTCNPTQPTTGNFANIGTGAYTITATDLNNCTSTTIVNILPLNGPSITNVISTNASCNGICDGTITVTSPTGTSFAITPQPSTNATGIFNGLCANTFTITVSDAALCSVTTSVTITEPTALLATTSTSTNVTCFGLNNGTINYNVSGGTGLISYTISPAAAGVGGNYSNLGPATYTVTATDANLCSITTSFVVTEPTALNVNSITTTSTLCSGQANGSITVNVSGGTPQYTVSTNPATTTVGPASSPIVITSVGPNTYTVTITDANGCTVSSTTIVNGSTPIVFSNVTIIDPTCNAACNGTINVTTTGGAGGNINYTIAPAGPQTNTTGNFTALCGGNIYTITATDANGCTETTTVTLIEPTALAINSSFTNPLCNGNSNGTISVSLNGGTPGYSYTSNPIATQPTAGNFTGLTAQCYTITGTDSKGCSITTSICLTDPTLLTWNNPSATNITCNGAANGIINAPATGGTGSKTYVLNPTAVSNTTGVFNGLTPQCYTVTATDANGCTITTSYCITEPTVLVMGAPALVNLLCNGASSGSITIAANGGTPNYTFTISPNQGTQATPGNFTNLPAGTYAITVTDGNGCTSIVNGLQLSEPPAITFNLVSVQDVACYGDATGTITVSAQGGTGGFNYSLNPTGNQSTPGFFTNLYAGNYVATATDANGCTLTTNINVKQNLPVVISSLTLTEPICFGESNGIIAATASGGVPPIQFSLSNSPFQTSGTFNNVPAGFYIISLRDALGCMRDSLIELTQPEPVGATIDLTGANCVDSKDGKAVITGMGGHGGYKYYLSPGLYINKSGVFGGLSAGTYTLRVVDTTGCEYSTMFTVSPPASALSNTMTKLDLACNGKGNEGLATANVSGGTPPYNFLWNTSPVQTTATASTLYYGWYKVEISDAFGCIVKDSVYIEEGPCCDVAFIPNAFSPNGDNNNDEFRILTTAGIELIQLEIYDRWGARIWSSSDYRRGWDGNYKDKEAPVDTYHYVLRYRCTRDGLNYMKKGDVILVR